MTASTSSSNVRQDAGLTGKLPVLSGDRAGARAAEFSIGIRSAPYLADHGFQDMVVLPGSFYVEMALRVDRERSKRVASLVRNVAFLNPILLSQEDTLVIVLSLIHI